MPVRVFLSHQHADSSIAEQISRRLRSFHKIESYLDVLDPYLGKDGDDLAKHVQTELGRCTQLLAVVSAATRTSWWVPWEIGIATEKQYPLATYSAGSIRPPEYLQKWPYLMTDADIDRYAEASKAFDRSFTMRKAYLSEGVALRGSTSEFHSNLRRALGQ